MKESWGLLSSGCRANRPKGKSFGQEVKDPAGGHVPGGKGGATS